MADDGAPDKAQELRELEDRLRELGQRLQAPPEDAGDLLKLLDDIEESLLKVQQKHAESTTKAMQPATAALVNKKLLGQDDLNIRLAVASCISEITRIAAPNIPYDDDEMKAAFVVIVWSLQHLDKIKSPLFRRVASILDTVAKVQSCVVMLDLECDDLILDMFHHFFRTASSEHPEAVRSCMETAMKLVIKESEDVHPQIASCLLENVRKDKDSSSPSFVLAEKVIVMSREKLKPVFQQLLKDTSLSEYSQIVTTVCEEGSDDKEDNNADTGDDTESDKIMQGVSCPEQDVTSMNDAPGDSVSSDATPADNGEESVSAKPKKSSAPETDQNKLDPSDKSEANAHADTTSSVEAANEAVDDTSGLASDKSEAAAYANTKKGHVCSVEAASGAADNTLGPASDKTGATAHTNTEEGHVSSVEAADGLADDTLGQASDKSEANAYADTKKEGPVSSVEAAKGSADDTSGLVAVTPVKRRGRPSGLKSLEKKAAGKKQPSSDVKKVADSAGKLTEQQATDDVKSGKGDSSKPKEISSKQENDETLSEEDLSKDLSLKEIVSAKSSTKWSGRPKRQSAGNSNQNVNMTSKRKRDQETTETPQSKKSKVLDESLVGARIKVWWPYDKAFYEGVVDSFDSVSKRHKIAYDDGDVEVLLLKKEKWKFLSEEKEAPVSSDTPRGRKREGVSAQPPKEDKTETPKSDGGDLPKKRGRPKGSGNRTASKNSATPSTKGKTESKDVEETPKTNEVMSSKDKATGSTNEKIKAELTKDGGSKSENKSEEAGSKGKDSKDEIKSTGGKGKPGRKPKSAPEESDGDKEKQEERKTAEIEQEASANASAGKKRRRKA